MLLILPAVPSVTLAQDEPAGDGTISVQVEMGTAGEALPANLEAELLFLPNGQGPPIITNKPIGEDGSVTFTDVDTAPEHRYLARVTVDGQEYFSQLLSFGPNEREQSTSVTVYATTTDLSQLSVAGATAIAEARENQWVVAMLYNVVNSTDRGIVPVEGEGLFVPVPDEATDLSFQDPDLGEQSERLANGVQVNTTFPPGQQRIVFSYVLPYRPPAQTLELPIGGTPVQLMLLVADLGQQVNVPTLTPADPLQADSGQNYLAYEGADQPADGTIQVEMTGLPAETPAATGAQPATRQEVPVGLDQRLPWWTPLALILVTVAGVAVYLWQRPAPTAAEEQAARRRRRDALLDRIADLDDRYDAGVIGEQTYKRQREAARRELKHLLRSEDQEQFQGQTP